MKQERGETGLAPMYQMLAKVCIVIVIDTGCILGVHSELAARFQLALLRAEGRLHRAD